MLIIRTDFAFLIEKVNSVALPLLVKSRSFIESFLNHVLHPAIKKDQTYEYYI